jgi:DNA-binding response OmpR family regulator
MFAPPAQSVVGRVLVLDDEPALRREMSRAIAGGFDVAVSDIHRSGLDGTQLLREVRARRRRFLPCAGDLTGA